MAFCTKCGSQVADGAAHCTSCGAPMGGVVKAPPAAPQYAPPAAAPYAPPAAPQYGQPAYQAPMAPAQPNMLVTMFNGLDLGAKIAGAGGLVAAVGFFLPWGVGGSTSNGMDATKSFGAMWLVFLLPLVAVGLLYFAYNNDLRAKIFVAAAHCAIGTVMAMLFFSPFFSGAQMGWTLNNLGLLAITVGGFTSIFELTKRLVGVR